MEACTEFDELLGKYKDHENITIRCIRDDAFVIFYLTVRAHFDQCDFDKVLQKTQDFLLHVFEHKIKYNFIFDNHECDHVPYAPMYALMQKMKENPNVVEACLQSTVIITRNKMMKMVIDTAFEMFKPVKPVRIILFSAEEDVLREALEFSRASRVTSLS